MKDSFQHPWDHLWVITYVINWRLMFSHRLTLVAVCWPQHCVIQIYCVYSWTSWTLTCEANPAVLLREAFLGRLHRRRIVFVAYQGSGRSCLINMPAAVLQIADFLVHLHQEKCHSISAVRGYHSAFNHTFALKGMDHTDEGLWSSGDSFFWWMVLQSIMRAPYRPHREVSYKDLILPSLLLLPQQSDWVSCMVSYSIACHSECWKSYSIFIPEFLPKSWKTSFSDSIWKFHNHLFPQCCGWLRLRNYCGWYELLNCT